MYVIPHVACMKSLQSAPLLHFALVWQKGRNGEFLCIESYNPFEYYAEIELGQGTQAFNACKHCKQLENRKRSCTGIKKGHVSPITDQSWGFGEVLQLGQTVMRFGRQVDNIILT